MKRHIRTLGIITIAILFTLACNLSTGTPNPDPNTVNTQAAMALTQTALNNVPLVPSATVGVPTQDPNIVNTQVAMAMTQTAMNIVPLVPSATVGFPTQDLNLVNTQVAMALTVTAMNVVPTQPAATTTQEQPPPPVEQDIQALIDSSNILVYEDMASDYQYITVVARALKSVGGHHEYVGDAMGTFMDKLNSGTQWDLIIVAAEARDAISGDYWTELKDKVDDGAALVAEAYYLNDISDGKIAPFLRECGVDVQGDWQAGGGNRIDYGMYWVDPSNPVFNTPNRVIRFGAWLTDPAWPFGDIGDFLEVTDSSKAELLASLVQGEDSKKGLITSCMDGRVIFQTFSSHNYPTNDMVALWENYINYTLTNHFLAAP